MKHSTLITGLVTTLVLGCSTAFGAWDTTISVPVQTIPTPVVVTPLAPTTPATSTG